MSLHCSSVSLFLLPLFFLLKLKQQVNHFPQIKCWSLQHDNSPIRKEKKAILRRLYALELNLRLYQSQLCPLFDICTVFAPMHSIKWWLKVSKYAKPSLDEGVLEKSTSNLEYAKSSVPSHKFMFRLFFMWLIQSAKLRWSRKIRWH